MSHVIVSSYANAQSAYRKYRPRFVVSILEADEGPTPRFDGLAPENHLVMSGNCSASAEGGKRCDKLVRFGERWDRKEPILIHCHQGACRSMAVAYILLCAAQPGASEAEIARQMRNAAPHADPNLLLISEADALLERDDRMVEAILDLRPAAGAVCDDVVALPLAG
ncbi:MAG: hypothetical protein AAFW81_07795 [Pseudomonadota bacterium]